MPNLVISVRETVPFPLLGNRSATQQLAKVNLTPSMASDIESGAVAIKLPGDDMSTGTVLDIKEAVSLPLLGRSGLELLIQIEA